MIVCLQVDWFTGYNGIIIEHLKSGALWNIEVHLKLLFSVNCQATIASRVIFSLHFHHLWVCPQWITLFSLTCGSATLWEMWVHQIQDFPLRWVRHLLTVVYRTIRSLHFPHLWACHTVKCIIPPHMWVRHTVRNEGPSHLGFPFPVGPPSCSLCKHSFQSY